MRVVLPPARPAHLFDIVKGGEDKVGTHCRGQKMTQGGTMSSHKPEATVKFLLPGHRKGGEHLSVGSLSCCDDDF
eukprot:4461131-Pyramimonas_sp.AAC.2